MGLVIQKLNKKAAYVGKDAPHLYFAGNGSKILDWLTNGNFRANNQRVNEIFRSIFEHSSDLRHSTTRSLVTLSAEPKAESAFGLVCEGSLRDEWKKDYGVLAGEDFRIGETKDTQSWETDLNPGMLGKHLTVDSPMPKIVDFLECFNNATADNEFFDRVNIEPNDIKTISDKINNDLHIKASKDQKDVVVEPIFIIALKRLVKLLAKKTQEVK